ncbi:Acyl carrier protein phosphodiesterase [Flavobacterium gillisiae]|uniref:Acyl carrier protein phosphodiesterase n=1 Tax=Flavobacterium gillisiae TaxID=150146 RepID=A0A1H3ZT83_9FLAO|nr:acyl carrier protein phosphodiesterase [Flavobacterium gillisiae]SEA26927.1 Acyl carrier protein phosphodiesterase [Flavobacterium gillisiae]
MNFLAHIYLSGDNDLIKIGNFMADGIRGKQFKNYPLEVQKGIMLHRAIDTFTDAHPIFRQSTKKLHSRYHHYSGVIVDVFYDHFLAKNWAKYSNEDLETYVTAFYQSLNDNIPILSERTISIMPYMIKQNWLLSYQTIVGIDKILTQMDSRTKNESKMRFASEELTEFYTVFEQDFTDFFEELRAHARQKLIEE